MNEPVLVIDIADVGRRTTWISRSDFYAALNELGFRHIGRIELLREIRILTPGTEWEPKGYDA